MRTIRIGSGAGYSGDRIEPAVELAEKGDIQYLVFECLGERTVALAQQARMKNPDAGFDPLLEERMRAVLPLCAAKGIKIVTNMGAANPVAAARKTAEIAKSLGLSSLKIAAIVGDDVLDACKDGDLRIMEFDGSIRQLGNRLLSANAYLGAEPMAQALNGGADIVITGRASDPALFLAPMIHAFGWAMDDWNLLGQGTVAGHLLECAGQITGGYFADPGYKDVPDLARLGFPIGEVGEDGSLVITKVLGSGGGALPQQIPVVHRPAEGMDHRRQEQRGVRGAPGDDDIGTAIERFRHRCCAKISVGRQQPVAELLDGAVEFHDSEIAILAGIEHIVAEDRGDFQRR